MKEPSKIPDVRDYVVKEYRRLQVRKEVYEAIMRVKKQNNLKSASQVIDILFKLSQLNKDLKNVFKMDVLDDSDHRIDHLNTTEATEKRRESLEAYYNRGKKK
ncbi:hypothetical protein SAMN06313540_11216 [Epsilonproteobacteria bacterium SCGC AD-308-E02]|jgi:hypothetical protein|nr:hypothetical protein SAMN06313540_11216 [Epsilonproteobacteria bacterium SCGC AD-308-E02]